MCPSPAPDNNNSPDQNGRGQGPVDADAAERFLRPHIQDSAIELIGTLPNSRIPRSLLTQSDRAEHDYAIQVNLPVSLFGKCAWVAHNHQENRAQEARIGALIAQAFYAANDQLWEIFGLAYQNGKQAEADVNVELRFATGSEDFRQSYLHLEFHYRKEDSENLARRSAICLQNLLGYMALYGLEASLREAIGAGSPISDTHLRKLPIPSTIGQPGAFEHLVPQEIKNMWLRDPQGYGFQTIREGVPYLKVSDTTADIRIPTTDEEADRYSAIINDCPIIDQLAIHASFVPSTQFPPQIEGHITDLIASHDPDSPGEVDESLIPDFSDIPPPRINDNRPYWHLHVEFNSSEQRIERLQGLLQVLFEFSGFLRGHYEGWKLY